MEDIICVLETIFSCPAWFRGMIATHKNGSSTLEIVNTLPIFTQHLMERILRTKDVMDEIKSATAKNEVRLKRIDLMNEDIPPKWILIEIALHRRPICLLFAPAFLEID